jgi:hypothetical protein
MKNSTGIFTGWVLVYNDNRIILLKHYQEDLETVAIHHVETFNSESAMNARITELNLQEA